MPKRNRAREQKKAQQSAAPIMTAPQPVPETVPSGIEPDASAETVSLWDAERLNQRLRSYEMQRFAPSHKLCSIMGYLIGIPEQNFFDKEHSLLSRSVFEKLAAMRTFRTIRSLCRIRRYVMLNCQKFYRAFSDNTAVILSIFPQDLQKEIRQESFNCNVYPQKRDVYEYLIQLNDELLRALDRADRAFRDLFPSFVEPMHLRNLLLFPKGTNAKNVHNISLFFFQNRTKYPWQYYMNLSEDLPEYLILSGDDYLLENAYRLAGDEAKMLWCFRTPYKVPGAKEQLHKFLQPEGDYRFHFLIDGVSMTVEKILAVLRELTPAEYDRTEKIWLFCCRDTYQNWKLFFHEHIDKIHAVEVETPVTGEEKREDISVNMSACLFGSPRSTAYLLMTQDEELFCSVSADIVSSRHPMCVITGRHAPDSILNYVNGSIKHPYCLVEEFGVEKPVDIQSHAYQVLQRKFPLVLRENLRRLLEVSIMEIPTQYSRQQIDEIYRQALENIRLCVDEDGTVRIEL